MLTASPPAPPCRWPSSRQPPSARSRSSRSQPRSSEHTGAPELHEMLGGARSRLTDSVCLFQGAGPQSARSPVQVARQPPRACSRSSHSQSAVSRVPFASPPSPPFRWPASRQPPHAHSRSSRFQSAVSSVRVRGPSAPPCRWLPLPEPERGGSLPLPFIFQHLCAISRLRTSHLNTQCWRCSFVEIQMYLSASQADSVDVPAGLIPIQLNSGDRLKKGSPTPLPS